MAFAQGYMVQMHTLTLWLECMENPKCPIRQCFCQCDHMQATGLQVTSLL